jgi:GMP synthase-like glutamine amidotransferase
MVQLLVLNMFRRKKYQKTLKSNLEYLDMKSDWVSYRDFDGIDFSKYSHIIITGSEYLITNNEIVLNRDQIFKLLSLKKPILAICYGFQLFTHHLVKDVVIDKLNKTNKGMYYINTPLSKKDTKYFFNHNDIIKHLDHNWLVFGKNKDYILEGKLKEFNLLGIQYHPENNPQSYDFIDKWINANL